MRDASDAASAIADSSDSAATYKSVEKKYLPSSGSCLPLSTAPGCSVIMVVGSPKPPLQVVLGSLSSDTNSKQCAAASRDNSTAYILGTSAYPNLGSGLKLKIDGRVPMEDRKAPLSQFRPKSLLLSVSLPSCTHNHL